MVSFGGYSFSGRVGPHATLPYPDAGFERYGGYSFSNPTKNTPKSRITLPLPYPFGGLPYYFGGMCFAHLPYLPYPTPYPTTSGGSRAPLSRYRYRTLLCVILTTLCQGCPVKVLYDAYSYPMALGGLYIDYTSRWTHCRHLFDVFHWLSVAL